MMFPFSLPSLGPLRSSNINSKIDNIDCKILANQDILYFLFYNSNHHGYISRMGRIMTLNCTSYVDYWNGYYLKFQCGMHNLDSPVLLIIHHHFDVDDICFCFECVHIICSYAWRSWAFESFIRHVWIMYGLDQQHVMIILYLNLINNKNRNQTTEIVLCNEIFFE